jgi:hypothetical protein
MYSASANTFSHSLPAGFQSTAAAAGFDWQAVLAAMEKYGVPLVVGVVTAVSTGNYLSLVALAFQYGEPLIRAVLAALGKPLPAVA